MTRKANDTVTMNVKRIIQGLNPFRNLGLKLLALFLALVALYFVAGQLIVKEIEVPLYIPFPSGLSSVDPLPEKVNVRILSSGTILGTLDKNQIYFDFKNIDYKEGELFLSLEEHIKTPPGVDVAKITPPKIRIVIDKKIIKRIPVDVKWTGRPPQGYGYLKHEAHPQTISIQGPRRIVDAITRLETYPISLTNRTEPFSIDAPIQLENLNVELADDEPVILNVFIAKNLRNLSVRSIPVQVISPPESFTINPRRVTAYFVCGSENVSKIRKEDIAVKVDLSTGIQLKREFRAMLKIEIINQTVRDNCRFRYFSQKRVDVLITKLGRRE